VSDHCLAYCNKYTGNAEQVVGYMGPVYKLNNYNIVSKVSIVSIVSIVYYVASWRFYG